MKVHIRQTARENTLAAALFYESQEVGLGEEVLTFLEHKVLELTAYAGIHPMIRGFYRAPRRGRFPYFSVYYTLESYGLWVRAVLEQRRDPRILLRRLRQV